MQSDVSYSALSPVVHGNIGMNINTIQYKTIQGLLSVNLPMIHITFIMHLVYRVPLDIV